jgi:hypothetical protein
VAGVGAGVGVRVGDGVGGASVGPGVAGSRVGHGLGDGVAVAVGAGEPTAVADGWPAVGELETAGLGLAAGAAHAATRVRIRSVATD